MARLHMISSITSGNIKVGKREGVSEAKPPLSGLPTQKAQGILKGITGTIIDIISIISRSIVYTNINNTSTCGDKPEMKLLHHSTFG